MKKGFIAIVILFSIIILSSATISAQIKTFKWESELCEFEGTYDSSKYTETQLRNTYELRSSLGAIPLFTDATVGKYEDIKTLSLEELDKEYKERSEKLKNLDIVKGEFWEKMRQDKLKEMNKAYYLKRLTIQGYANPAILREYKGAESCSINYAEPLIAGGDSLIGAWRKVNLDSQKRNGSPETLQRRFDEQNASPDRLKYARIEVMRFGWWNCINQTIPYVEYDEKQQENFDKLFIKIKEFYCDEP